MYKIQNFKFKFKFKYKLVILEKINYLVLYFLVLKES